MDIDFERKTLHSCDLLIVSPWQVHQKPTDGEWEAAGWIFAFAPEFLSESEALAIEEYALSPHPIAIDSRIADDLSTLCPMLKRNAGSPGISAALANTITSIALSTLAASGGCTSRRYKAITLKLRKLLDVHLVREKSPAAYASMLNISEVYLNEAVKSTTGLSAGAYIRNCAIVQARRQLAYTSLSAKEIAYSLGYNDYAYFSKLFSKCVGKSPSEYRKNLK